MLTGQCRLSRGTVALSTKLRKGDGASESALAGSSSDACQRIFRLRTLRPHTTGDPLMRYLVQGWADYLLHFRQYGLVLAIKESYDLAGRRGSDYKTNISKAMEAAPEGPDLMSFAAITDEPPAEVAAAGHERCIIPIRPEHVDAWLTPDPANLAAQHAILDDRARPFYEYRPTSTGWRLDRHLGGASAIAMSIGKDSAGATDARRAALLLINAAIPQRAAHDSGQRSIASKLAPDWHQPIPESKKVSRR